MTQVGTQVAKILSRKVRILSVDQIADHYFAHRAVRHRAAMSLIRDLESEGLVTRREVCIRQPTLRRLSIWQADDNVEPDFEDIASRSRKRWLATEPERTTVITANKKAVARFGGKFRQVRPQEVQHDLAVSNLFLTLTPEQQQAWFSEDQLQNEFGTKKPDAVVVDGENIRVIEVVGSSYTSTKLQSSFQYISNFSSVEYF